MTRLTLKKGDFAKISAVENIRLSKKSQSLFADFAKQNTPNKKRRRLIKEMFTNA